MNAFSTFLMILMVLILGFAGYYYLDQIVPLRNDHTDLEQKNQELMFQVEQLQRQNGELLHQLEEKVKQVSETKNQEIDRLKKTYESLIGSLEEQVEKGEVTITRLADQLNVKIVDRVIFPSGKADLSDDGKKVLTRVGDILKQVHGKRIRVEGHTDNVPIHPNLQDEFPSNWELSVMRAVNVVRFLQEDIGIPPQNLEATGLGEFEPVATNKTRRGRIKNRRIEILLLPNPSEIEKVTKNINSK